LFECFAALIETKPLPFSGAKAKTSFLSSVPCHQECHIPEKRFPRHFSTTLDEPACDAHKLQHNDGIRKISPPS
jgi:hypothetical protein